MSLSSYASQIFSLCGMANQIRTSHSRQTKQNYCSSRNHTNTTLCPLQHTLSSSQLEINSYFTVQPVDTLQYLGFFINQRLKWEPHVRIMCNRAHASIKALQVLGNSICRLSMVNWRLVLNAVCLPVMTWGCQLWFRQGGTKGLVKSLQQVQNKMVKVVTGSFHTAPRETLYKSRRCYQCIIS
jgi:hypothetical protein